MTKLYALFLLPIVSLALPHRFEWESFKVSHGKLYKNQSEEERRMNIFFDNLRTIKEHNKKYQQNLVTYYMKMNRFGDLTEEEYRGMMMKSRNAKDDVHLLATSYTQKIQLKLPDSMDWRDKGAVTPVKDQGTCGSCWAFSATGSLEGQHFLSSGQLVPLSEQQLMDCSADYGNVGCTEGNVNQAFIYLASCGGSQSEQTYPYQGNVGTCRFNTPSVVTKVTGVINIQQDEASLQNAVAVAGPVSVAIDSAHKSFQFYGGGIFYEEKCNASNIDHGVLVVGYGTQNGVDFWLVKNSWGTKWGEAGYVKMSRNKGNNCGIATKASYPKV